MQFDGIKPNNRIQIECEHDDPTYRNIRGIVVEVSDSSLILVSDFGELLQILEQDVLSIQTVVFPKIVSDNLIKIKNYFTEIYELEFKLKKLKEEEIKFREDLFDANFLAKFNVRGAKNRLEKSIPLELLNFSNDSLEFKIKLDSNPNDEITIDILVSNQFDYPNLNLNDSEKIIRNHAPDKKEVIQKAFPFTTRIEEVEHDVVHEEDTLYSVRTRYRLKFDITQDGFLERRQQLTNGLTKLRH